MTPIQLITFAKSRVEKIGRATGSSVIGTAEGDNSRDYDSEVFATHGIVSRPSKATRGIRIRIGNLGIVIAAFTYGVEPPENEGACKVYSTDADGVEKSALTLDSDGKASFKNDSDDLAKCIDDLISELKAITTYGSPTNHSLSASNVANLTTIANRFKSLLKEARRGSSKSNN